MGGIRFQVLGYRNFNRKADNKPMSIITAFSECTPADNSRGTYGLKVTDFFLPDEKVGSLNEDCVGQEFIPEYGISGFGKL